jgi:hypothetical protein
VAFCTTVCNLASSPLTAGLYVLTYVRSYDQKLHNTSFKYPNCTITRRSYFSIRDHPVIPARRNYYPAYNVTPSPCDNSKFPPLAQSDKTIMTDPKVLAAIFCRAPIPQSPLFRSNTDVSHPKIAKLPSNSSMHDCASPPKR